MKKNKKSIEMTLDMKKESLKYAHDIRKFEIDLLWRRSTFIWTIITVILTGVVALITKNDFNDKYQLKIILSFLGLFISICWYYMNRASKLWQDKWECCIMANEDDVTGPLYKNSSTYEVDSNFFKLTDAYSFSPSKILIIISLFFILIWAVLITLQIYEIFTFIQNNTFDLIVSIIITILGMIILFFLMYKFSKSRIESE